ncbi:MAG TPA: hypothetical protein VFS08_05020 [Gemmatimonadaceae bacterium]|nr:hypothetical protein [Gemmatimonadaceae bacterium]
MCRHEQWFTRRRWRGAMALALAAALAGACSAPGGRTDYVEGDSGAQSPGIAPDSSTARMLGPDSSSGGRTGRPGMAGDTTGARGMPAGSTDSATRAALDSAGRRGATRPDSATGVVKPPR